MMRIAILHPGEMGAAVGQALREVGHTVCWLPAGRGSATHRRAEEAGLVASASLDGCDVVLSICPPAAALDVAQSVAYPASGFTGLYVDANAVSPRTAQRVMAAVTAGGATYVDAGIIGPPPVRATTTRLYASGPDAAQVIDLFTGSRIDARPLDGSAFAASSLKMTYAAWTKISSALLLSARAAAVRLGVEPALAEEWALSQPDLAHRWTDAAAAATSKGWRWEAEMHQIAETFTAADEPEGFGTAAAQVFAAYPRPES